MRIYVTCCDIFLKNNYYKTAKNYFVYDGSIKNNSFLYDVENIPIAKAYVSWIFDKC